MKVAVKILPRDEVLDTQGRAVETSLNRAGQPVESCRVGKYIVLEIKARSADEAEQKVKAMADYVLYNPLIEKFELEVLR